MRDVTVETTDGETLRAPNGVVNDGYVTLLIDDVKECIPWHQVERVSGTIQ